MTIDIRNRCNFGKYNQFLWLSGYFAWLLRQFHSWKLHKLCTKNYFLPYKMRSITKITNRGSSLYYWKVAPYFVTDHLRLLFREPFLTEVFWFFQFQQWRRIAKLRKRGTATTWNKRLDCYFGMDTIWKNPWKIWPTTLRCQVVKCPCLTVGSAELPPVFRSEDWSVEDKVLFEQAYAFHGKSFRRIQQLVRRKWPRPTSYSTEH